MEPILLTAHQDVVPEEGGDLDPWETPTSVVPGIDVVFQKLFGSIIPKADKIDVHHHWVPPEYADAVGFEGDPSGWPRPQWSLESSEELMKRAGIKKSILSITAPGACILKGKQSWDLARTLNTKAAEIRDSKPDTFGFFLTLGNILDTNEALAEIAYGFDELEADGVCLFTRYDSDENFGDPNKYLGHREFGPIWKELDRRKAVVFVHPTHPRDISRANFLLYQPIVDYPHETTRTAMDMLLSGTRSEFPDCQVILSHAGGTLPYLIPRVEALLVSGHHQQVGLVLIPTERILRDYRSFHFDIALSTSNATIKTLLETGVPKENILFGSDFPYAPESAYPAFLKHWQEADISSEQRRKVHSENAVRLFEKAGVKGEEDVEVVWGEGSRYHAPLSQFKRV